MACKGVYFFTVSATEYTVMGMGTPAGFQRETTFVTSCLFHWMKKFLPNVVSQRKEFASERVNYFLSRVDSHAGKNEYCKVASL